MACPSLSTSWIVLPLITLALCAPTLSAPVDVASTDSNPFVESPDDASWTGIARCALEVKAPLDCVEARSKRAVEILLENERRKRTEARATGTADDDDEGDVFDEDVEHLVDRLSEAIADAAGDALERRLRGVVSMRSLAEPKEDSKDVEEGQFWVGDKSILKSKRSLHKGFLVSNHAL